MRVGFLGALSVGCLLYGCGPAPIDPRIAEEERQREREEELAAQEAAKAAEKLEKRDAFCEDWTTLYCTNLLDCHPAMTSSHLQDCKNRLAPFCQTRMDYKEWNVEAANACFLALADFDCSKPLEERFAEACNDVIPIMAAVPGDSCSFGGSRQCQNSVCLMDAQPDNYVLSCSGTCAVEVGEGEDCETAPCAEGLLCVQEKDDRGLPLQVCRVDTFEPQPEVPAAEVVHGCKVYEQWVESESRCITKSLPGEACGGAFDLGCVASVCVSDVCSWGVTNGNYCSYSNDCMWPYKCVEGYDGFARCGVHDNSCHAHPMWLYQ